LSTAAKRFFGGPHNNTAEPPRSISNLSVKWSVSVLRSSEGFQVTEVIMWPFPFRMTFEAVPR